jgi:hypothetical protein
MRRFTGLTVAVALAFSAPAAGAAILLSDSFESEPTPAGGFDNDYNTFANFFVADGTVDLLAVPNGFGLFGTGNFVDLDGSAGDAGYLETINQFSFDAGTLVTLNFLASGSQRQGYGSDRLFGGFRFFTPTSFTDVTYSGFTSVQQPSGLLLGVADLAPGDPYAPFQISFRATSAGSIDALIGADGGDNVGPLLDNVNLLAFVPEPTTWALMILGFGGVGAALRSRRRRDLQAAT